MMTYEERASTTAAHGRYGVTVQIDAPVRSRLRPAPPLISSSSGMERLLELADFTTTLTVNIELLSAEQALVLNRLTLLHELFSTWAERWRKDTEDFSSPTRIAMHPDYQRIISKGESMLPFILEDLRDHGGEWYWALKAISGESPVPADAAGRRQLVDEAWLNWGRQRGYIN